MCYENSNFRNMLASAGVRLMCTKGRQHPLTAPRIGLQSAAYLLASMYWEGVIAVHFLNTLVK